MNVVVDLEEGLPLEVDHSLEILVGSLIGLVKAVDDGRPFAADVMLEVVASSLQSCLARHSIQTPPSPDATTASKQRWRELEDELTLLPEILHQSLPGEVARRRTRRSCHGREEASVEDRLGVESAAY
jgi:hypothetical protein